MRKAESNSRSASLRDALYQMVHHSRVPAKVQAEELGMGYSYLCNAANPNLDGFDYQLRLLVPHSRLTGNFAAVDYIERTLGRVGVPVLAEPPGSVRDVLQTVDRDIVQVAKELGDVAQVIMKCARDKRFTPREARLCQQQVWDLIQEGARLYHFLDEVAQGEVA